jgi:microcompartment protein CcmL/EutN
VTLADHSAIALLEFSSIAMGVRAGDAMVKRAPVDLAYAGTIHPGNYVVLVAGDVACVEEAYQAGLDAGTRTLLDRLFLPAVHPEVVQAILGRRGSSAGEALGMVETRTIAATIGAADSGLKGAEVALVEIRLADRIGGKGYCAFSGPLAEVEAAVEVAVNRLDPPDALVADVVIPKFHEEMLANIEATSEFWTRINEQET